jgi:hypothetical protein
MLQDHGAEESVPLVHVPPVWPRALLVLVRVFLIPMVAIARVLAWLEEQVAPHRHQDPKVPLQVESKPQTRAQAS